MARAGEELFNRLTGERIVFVRTAADSGGEALELDDHWTRPGHRAPEHVHPQMQERWEVRAGLAGFRIARSERTAGPGELVVAEPGVPHLAWNAGEEPVHLRIQLRPALGWEEFVVELFALANDAHERGAQDPDLGALLELLGRYPREVAPAPPPSASPPGAPPPGASAR